MKLKDLRIGTQLNISFAVVFLLIIIMGVVSYIQTDRIHEQTQSLYEHPLQVRRAIGALKADILAIHRDMKDIFLSHDEAEVQSNLYRIEQNDADVFKQMDILHEFFLGPKEDVDTLRNEYIVWKAMRAKTIELYRAGQFEEGAGRTKSTGIAGKQVDIIMSQLQKIDDFSKNMGDQLFAASERLNKLLNIQLIVIVMFVLFALLLTNYLLRKNIKNPLTELFMATQNFDKGDLSVRSSYKSKNEFGKLSFSFNRLAENIQWDMELNQSAVDFSELMVKEEEMEKFFNSTLLYMMNQSGAQLAAAYLLSDDHNTYELIHAIGAGSQARSSFSAREFEGETGAVISSGKIQHIKKIPESTRFLFNTVSGTFIPREIISIPILSADHVIAVISLAGLNSFNIQVLRFIEKIHSAYSARINGIVASQKIKIFSERMEALNQELEAQKAELSMQSAELGEQNRELEMQKNQLSEASKLKTSFLSNMSHELRTPLNSVIALSGVLSRRLAERIPEEELSFLEIIERNGKSLLALINDILDISRIESGREEVNLSQFNICNQINDIVNMIMPQADLKKIKLNTASGDCNLNIESDINKFRHIVQNLVGNAVKFTEEGEVSISVQKTDESIEIFIADTGVGIAAEHLPYIFDEFRQADSGTSRKYGGSGLGLSIAKRYAIMLGGNISVKSTPAKGSEFILVLPLKFNLQNSTEQISGNEFYNDSPESFNSEKGFVNSSKTILLVDDSEPAIIQMRDFLEEQGYQVIAAVDGEDALQKIENNIPHAIILDLMMPGIDGFEVLKTIRDSKKTLHIPVLILTAKHITKEELNFLKSNNIYQLIQKGDVSRNELLNAVSGMLSQDYRIKTEKRIKSRPSGEKLKVLVVEDNPDNLTTLRALLEDTFVVVEAGDGMNGVEKANTELPDLILMDISLPVMDGIEAFKVIRSKARLAHIPVIVITASALTEDRESILAHGFDAFIPKPIEEKVLFEIINTVLYG